MNRRADEDFEEETFPKRETRIWYGANDPNAPDAIAPEFDPYDGDLLHDLAGKHMGPALETLFIKLRLHEMTAGSFGPEAVNNKVALEYLVPAIKELREACRKEFEQQEQDK